MIIIRRAKKGDVDGIAEFFNENLKAGHFIYVNTNKPFNKKKIIRWERDFAERDNGECTFIAIDSETNKIIGHSDFHSGKGRTRHRIDVGWMVHKDYSGKGIATKLVSALLEEAKRRGFIRAEAEAAVINSSSIKLAKKLGFAIEGRKKKALLLDNGRYSDTYIFGKMLG